MARPVGANAEATRAKVRREAARLFAERGVGGTPMRVIAQACGVTSATVHHYFGSKEDLYRTVVEAMYVELDSLRVELSGALGSACGGLGAILDEAVRRLFRFALQHDSTVRMLLRNAIETGELDPERRQEVHLPFLSDLSVALEQIAGLPAARTRLAIQSINHLIVRYALTTPEELGLIAGVPADQALAIIEEHLVQTARTLIGL